VVVDEVVDDGVVAGLCMGVGSDGVAVIVKNVKRFSLAQDDTHFVCVGTPGKQPFLFLLCCDCL
jgi:hypothetical protein